MGMICATLANIHRDPKKTPVHSPQDFMPSSDPLPEISPDLDDEQGKVAADVVATLGGMVTRKGNSDGR